MPLTPDEWERFSGKAKWDVMSALRGPDADLTRLKLLTTAVIRGKMRDVIRVGGIVNTCLPFALFPADYAVLIGGSGFGSYEGVSHFIGHVRDACGWLGIQTYHIPVDSWKALQGRQALWPATIPNSCRDLPPIQIPDSLAGFRVADWS